MGSIWLVSAGIVVLLSVVTVIVAYYKSDALLRPPKRRVPLNVFPDQFGLVFEKVVFQTADGLLLKGWFMPAASDSEKTVLLLHGWGNNRGEALTNAHFLHELGFNLFCFDFRGSGESDGSVSSVSYYENKDLEAALEYLRENRAEQAQSLGIYGISMGAGVGIYQAAQKPEIKCVVAEAVYDSYSRVVGSWAWLNMKVPYYPVMPLMLYFVKMKLGFDQESLSPILHVDRISPRPILFVHGSHDQLVNVRYAKKLFAKAKEPKELWIVPGAPHAKCAEVGGEEYRRRIGDFFNKYL